MKICHGDLIRLKLNPKTNLDMGVTSKLSERWSGPWKIIEIPKNIKNSYKVIHHEDKDQENPISVDMKNVSKWYHRPDWMKGIPSIEILDRPIPEEEFNDKDDLTSKLPEIPLNKTDEDSEDTVSVEVELTFPQNRSS